MGLIVIALAVLMLVILAAAVAVVSTRGGTGKASPTYDADRYEATERFRNNLPPSI